MTWAPGWPGINQDLTTIQRYVHLSPSAIEQAILLVDQPAPFAMPAAGCCIPETGSNRDSEGAVRAGRTTPAVLKIINSRVEHPGIQRLVARWTQDAADGELKARFRELCPPQAPARWNAQEQYFEIRGAHGADRRHLRSRSAASTSLPCRQTGAVSATQ